MAILGGTGFGLQGILQGQQIAQNNFALQQLAENSLRSQFDQQIFGDLVTRGFSPTQALGSLAQNSPILGSAIQNTGRALTLQQALLPQALVGAQQGNFGQLNSLANSLGPVGNFNAGNLSTNAVLPLFGADGLSAQTTNRFNERLLSSLLTGSTNNPFQSIGASRPAIAPPSFGADFGRTIPSLGFNNSFGLNTSPSFFNTGRTASSNSGGVSAAIPFGG